MKHSASRRVALLVIVAATSLAMADEALARRAKGSSAPGNPAARAQRAAAAAQAMTAPVDATRPLPVPRRHGGKGRPASR